MFRGVRIHCSERSHVSESDRVGPIYKTYSDMKSCDQQESELRPSGLQFIWRPLIAGFLAWLGTLILWLTLAWALWLPYWKELLSMHMYTHDIQIGYMLLIDPPIVGSMFLLATLLALLIVRFVRDLRYGIVGSRVVMLFPALATFGMLNKRSWSDGMWHYPLAEIAVLVVGLALSFTLLRSFRRPAFSARWRLSHDRVQR